MPQFAYIVMGSNIEPRQGYLDQAAQALQARFPDGFGRSNNFSSTPYQGLEQSDYLNGACRFQTDLSPQKLLVVLLAIEAELGRVRSGVHWGNRTVDLDIALFGDVVVQEKGLVIPHYDMENRDFFLVPLLELDPGLINPRSGEPLVKHLGKIPVTSRTGLHILGADA